MKDCPFSGTTTPGFLQEAHKNVTKTRNVEIATKIETTLESYGFFSMELKELSSLNTRNIPIY